MANLLDLEDLRARLEAEKGVFPGGPLDVNTQETIARLPVGRGATLSTEQPDLARETARGESMQGNKGDLGDAAPGFFARLKAGDPKTLRGVATMLFALSDAADRLSARPRGGNQAQQFLEMIERQNLAESREARARSAEDRAAAREAREAELFPLQKRAAQAQMTAAQLGNMKGAIDAFDLLSRRTANGTPEEKQAATNQALSIWKNLGLGEVISESAVRNIMARPDLLSSLTRYKPYLDQLPDGVVRMLRGLNFDDPQQLKGLFGTLDLLVGQAAQKDALDTASKAIASLKAQGKKGPFGARDLALAFVSKDLAFEKLESDTVAGLLAPDYVQGKTALKIREQTALAPGKIAEKVGEQEALLPGKVREQEALLPGRVEVAAATGREAAAAKRQEAETGELGEKSRLWINPKTLRAADPRQSAGEVKRLGFVPISEDQAKRRTDLQGAKAVTARLEALVDRVFDAEGLLGRLASTGAKGIGVLLQTDEDAVLYNSFVSGTVAPLIRSLGEKGTLATEDVGRALKLTPTLLPTDKRAVAKGKVKQLRDLLLDVERRTLLGEAGTPNEAEDLSKLSNEELKRRLGIR